MKKLLIVSLIAFAVQITCVSQETQFKHLNGLSEFSEIRKKCGGVSRAWFYRGELEILCDQLDDEFEKMVRGMSEIQSFGEELSNNKEVSLSSMIHTGLSIYNFSNHLVNESKKNIENIDKIINAIITDKGNGEREMEKALLMALIPDAIDRKINNIRK
jgi:hypothetical protein